MFEGTQGGETKPMGGEVRKKLGVIRKKESGS